MLVHKICRSTGRFRGVRARDFSWPAQAFAAAVFLLMLGAAIVSFITIRPRENERVAQQTNQENRPTGLAPAISPAVTATPATVSSPEKPSTPSATPGETHPVIALILSPGLSRGGKYRNQLVLVELPH